jgi:hypothetical protein
VDIYSIGFAKTTAEDFFTRLIESRVERVLDVANELHRTGTPGVHSFDRLGFGTPDRVVLLLSLGTNNNDWHAKLTAGVLRFP